MFRGKEVENNEEVGVEHVIKSPDHIESMDHHPKAGHQTRCENKTMMMMYVILSIVGSGLPEVNKVAELLNIKYQISNIKMKSSDKIRINE